MGAVSAAGERRDAVLDAEAHLVATLFVLQRLATDGAWRVELAEIMAHQDGALRTLRPMARALDAGSERPRRCGRRQRRIGGRTIQRQ